MLSESKALPRRFIVSPARNTKPSSGSAMDTTGAEPIVITMGREEVTRNSSETRNTTVNEPAERYSWVIDAPVLVGEPSPRSHV